MIIEEIYAGVAISTIYLKVQREDKEFEDKLDEVVLENAKVIELTGNNVFCRNLYEARRTNEYVQS